jgi:hypothetical protein
MIGRDAVRDEVVIFALKVPQSIDERYPETEAVEVGWDQVQLFPDDEAILMPEFPEVAKEAARYRVELPWAAKPTPPNILLMHVPFWTNPPALVPRQLLLVRPVNPRLVVVAVRIKALVEDTLPLAVMVVPVAEVKYRLVVVAVVMVEVETEAFQ